MQVVDIQCPADGQQSRHRFVHSNSQEALLACLIFVLAPIFLFAPIELTFVARIVDLRAIYLVVRQSYAEMAIAAALLHNIGKARTQKYIKSQSVMAQSVSHESIGLEILAPHLKGLDSKGRMAIISYDTF